MKIPSPVKIKNDDESSTTEGQGHPKPSEASVKPPAPPSPKKTKMAAAPTSGSSAGSPLKQYRCHLCKKMFTSSWNYAQHIKTCGLQRRKQLLREAALIKEGTWRSVTSCDF